MIIGTKFDYLLENIKPKSFKTSDFGISYISPADAQKLDFADGSFDIFYSWDVLEHIPKVRFLNYITQRTLFSLKMFKQYNLIYFICFNIDFLVVSKARFFKFT